MMPGIDANSLLVLAPHPDDEAIGCSGTLVLLNSRGAYSTVIYVTDGEKLHGESSPGIAEERREEGRKASHLLGCREERFLGIPDGEVESHADEAFNKISALIEEKKPDLILAPSPIDHHADHISVSRIAMRLLKVFPSSALAFYEVYSTLRFNCLVDIGEVVEKKKEAILNYRASLYGKPEIYVHAALGLNAQRSLFVQNKSYYEAFYLVKQGEDLASVLRHFCYLDR